MSEYEGKKVLRQFQRIKLYIILRAFRLVLLFLEPCSERFIQHHHDVPCEILKRRVFLVDRRVSDSSLSAAKTSHFFRARRRHPSPPAQCLRTRVNTREPVLSPTAIRQVLCKRHSVSSSCALVPELTKRFERAICGAG